jgi:hypothetical protein
VGYENEISNKTVSTVFMENIPMDKSIGYKSLHFIPHGFNRGL